MPNLKSAGTLLRSWLTSIPFFILFGLVLGVLVSSFVIPKPNVATITISGPIFDPVYTDDILTELRSVRDDNNIKAVVLEIDSPGGFASLIEPIYLDVLQLRQHKPIVVSIGASAASGGYYIAVAANYIYALPTSEVGSIGVIGSLPNPTELSEDLITTGPFKDTGGSRRKVTSVIETLKQQFLDAVVSQRGDRLGISEFELSRAQVYSGTESLRYGLIDDIGTNTAAIRKAASLANIRNYEVVERYIGQPFVVFIESSAMEYLQSQTGLLPIYYYLYIEPE